MNLKQVTREQEMVANYKRTLENQIVDLFELFEIKSQDNVRLVEKVNVKKVSVGEIKELLNIKTSDDDIFNNIIVEVDIKETIENLLYKVGVADPMAKKIGKKLKSLSESKYIELEIGKWWKTVLKEKFLMSGLIINMFGVTRLKKPKPF